MYNIHIHTPMHWTRPLSMSPMCSTPPALSIAWPMHCFWCVQLPTMGPLMISLATCPCTTNTIANGNRKRPPKIHLAPISRCTPTMH